MLRCSDVWEGREMLMCLDGWDGRIRSRQNRDMWKTGPRDCTDARHIARAGMIECTAYDGTWKNSTIDTAAFSRRRYRTSHQ